MSAGGHGRSGWRCPRRLAGPGFDRRQHVRLAVRWYAAAVDVAVAGVRMDQINQARRDGIDESMSTLEGAQRRLERALESLEAGLRTTARSAAPASDNESVLARDLELLREECDGLRRALDAALARERALAETVGEVTNRLDRTIDDLAEIVEG